MPIRLEANQVGDIVDVDRLGRGCHAFFAGNASGGLWIQPPDRRISYRSCRARDVNPTGRSAGDRGRPDEPLEPSRRSIPAARDQVAAALGEARYTGWSGLLAEQRAYLDDFWDRADVELDGDPELQQSVRFALFHALQAGARTERRAIAAKGLTGPGYDGHTFWDTESFVRPVLTYIAPHAAHDALRWRHQTLARARARATQLGLRGAAFPWRTIQGGERSGYWPAGTVAFHVNADIADAVVRYRAATADDAFDRDVGVELLVETARLWHSVGR